MASTRFGGAIRAVAEAVLTLSTAAADAPDADVMRLRSELRQSLSRATDLVGLLDPAARSAAAKQVAVMRGIASRLLAATASPWAPVTASAEPSDRTRLDPGEQTWTDEATHPGSPRALSAIHDAARNDELRVEPFGAPEVAGTRQGPDAR